MSLKSLKRIVATACAVMLAAGAAQAQTAPYPSRPIKILVGFAAGGGIDTIARIYGQKLQEILGQPIIVENKPGASELQAITPLVNAQPDGYTLMMTSASSMVRGPGVRTDLPYDPLKQMTFIAKPATVEAVYVVKNDLPIKTVPELLAYARTHPNKLNYGSAGIGSSNHLLTEQMKMLTKTELVHIPYKSDAEVAREMAAGTLDFSIAITTFTVPFIKDNKIRALAVTGSQRSPALPNVPTLDESGAQELKGLGNYLFYGLVGPANLPQPIVAKLNDAMNKAAAMPDVAQRLEQAQFRPTTSTPSEFRQLMEKELAKWKEIGKTVKVGNF
jgi:tripartite-type tricarboxylate transporter receptor subunit TctC